MPGVLRALIRELNSPVGDSVAELMTDIDEVIDVIDGLCKEVGPKTRFDLLNHKQDLRMSSNRDGRMIANSIASLLEYIEDNDEIDAPGLELRLQTLLRRSLPTSGTYDAPQTHLKPPFDPSKAGRFTTIV